MLCATPSLKVSYAITILKCQCIGAVSWLIPLPHTHISAGRFWLLHLLLPNDDANNAAAPVAIDCDDDDVDTCP